MTGTPPTTGPEATPLSAAAARRTAQRNRTHRALRRAVLSLLGVLITLAGVAMLALPGPGALVIVLGLWVLALEYEWAERRLDAVKDKVIEAAHAAAASRLRVAGSLLIALAMLLGGIAWGLHEDWPFSDWWTAGSFAGGGILAAATTIWARMDHTRRPRG